MEENELEEGEAFPGEEHEDPTVDPDVALSYIDEKIQSVLGHFQKDFEGGVCAENLGAKFGGYGSFLPAHQQSPSILSQPRSPQKTLNYKTSRSPYDAQSEGTHVEEIEAPANAPTSSRNSCPSTAILLDKSSKKNVNGSGPKALETSPQQNLVSGQDNCNYQKTLKVRVRVGPEKVLSRNNADIYSGLGLDISPSPSLEESFDDSQGSSPKSQDAFVDSPTAIYEFYAFLKFAPRDSYMFSPISESLLCLEEKNLPQLKECKTGDRILSCGPTTMNVRSSFDKITKSTQKNPKPFEVQKSNIKDGGNDTSVILKREISNETTVGREIVSGALDIPLTKLDEDVSCQLARKSIKAADVMKEEQDSVANIDANRFYPSGNERSHIKTRLNLKTALTDKPSEVKKIDILKDDTTNGLSKACKPNVDKSRNAIKDDYEGNKMRKDQVVGPAEPIKLKTPQGALCSEEGEVKLPQRKVRSSSGRRNSDGSEANDVPSNKLLKEYTSGVGPVMKKDKKKNLHLKNDSSESKFKGLKSHKVSDKIISREHDSNHVGFAKVEQADDRIDSSEFLPRDKPTDLKLEYKKEETFSNEKMKEKRVTKKIENVPISEPFNKVSSASLQLSNVPTSTVPPPTGPHFIKEHWVACDECGKWRLLPYEADTSQLPKIWRCSMLNWLPGKNKCSVTEEETTKSLQELYNPPVTECVDGANGITSSSAIATGSQLLPQNHDFGQRALPVAPKKKFSEKDATITTCQSSSIQFSHPSRENQLVHIQSRNTDNQKSKHKDKNKMSERYSDGGDSEQRGKHSKSKRREIYQDNETDLKRIKLLESYHGDDDCNSNHSLGGKTVPISVNVLPSKASGKSSQNKEFISSNSSKFDQKEKLSTMRKNMKAPVHAIANGTAKERSSLDSEKSDIAKKRRVEDCQESGVHPQTSEVDMRKDKKVKISRSDGRKPSTNKNNSRSGKDSHLTGVQLPCGGQDQFLDRINVSMAYADKDHQLIQRNADGLDSSLKKDAICAQPSTAATSSSSKVSGSRKSKVNFQEARDSPVESVSSSPLRISNSDIPPTRRNLMGKDDSIQLGYSVMGSPRRSSEGEADGVCNPFQAKVKGKFVSAIRNASLESNRAAESSVLDPMKGACDLQAREMDTSKAKDQLFTKIFGCTDFEPSPSEYVEINRGDGVAVTPKPQRKYKSGDQGRGHDHITDSNPSKKSGKSSSSWSRERVERHKNSKIDKGKMKTSELFNDLEDLHTKSNEDHVRYSTAMDSNGRHKSHEDFKDNSLEKKEQKSYSVKIRGSRSSEGKRDGHSHSRLQENMEAQGSSLPVNKHANSRVTEPPAFSGNMAKIHVQGNMSLTREEQRSSDNLLTDHMERLEMGPGRGHLESASHPGEKQDAKNQTSHSVRFLDKEGRSGMVLGKAENGGVDNGHRHIPKIESQNGANHNNLRNLTSNKLDVVVSVRKESGPSAILKEARGLKHTANHLKSEGLDQESTGLYFQAALKFLHVALLLENCSESGKHGDMISSIQMYSETAKLCEFCAHEYEKHKQIAASALAYKCMEVAYMKVVYFKHSSANIDCHELQIAPQLHGESPSSSASDVDNLNNSNMIDKVASVKGLNSPLVAGNHIIAARNRPNFVRLLSYAENVNSAMEASKKSLNAFVAASANLDGQDKAEALSSVKKVLDFSFHDIEGLLRLVRLSVELVSS